MTNNEELIKKFNSAIFPDYKEDLDACNSLKRCFKEALSDDFKTYSKNVNSNAKVLSDKLTEKGFKIFSGGTDTHLMLVDLRDFNVTGKDAEASLVRSNITVIKTNSF